MISLASWISLLMDEKAMKDISDFCDQYIAI